MFGAWSLAARIAAPLLLLAALAASVWGYGHRQRLQGRADVRAEWTAAQLEATQEARRIEAHRAQMVQGVTDAHAKDSRIARAAAADARTELQRLLDATAERERQAGDPGAAGGADDPPGARSVVRACASSLVRLAEVADAVEARLTALQAYVRGVCLSEGASSQR